MTSPAWPSRTIVAQISDPHIKRPGEIAYGIVDTAAALRRCVAFLNAIVPPPDVVVVTGDLVDFGRPDEYAHFRELIADLSLPVLLLPGNHDERDALREAFPDHPYLPASGALNGRVIVGPLTLLLLDSSVPGRPYGYLSDDTLDWLDAAFADRQDSPTLIFLHHPPFVTGIRHMDVQNLRNADALTDKLRGRANVKLVSAGHVHRTTMLVRDGIPFLIAAGTSHAVAFDFDPAGAPAFREETPGIFLHVWTADEEGGGELVTHALPIGEFGQAHPFFDAAGNLL